MAPDTTRAQGGSGRAAGAPLTLVIDGDPGPLSQAGEGTLWGARLFALVADPVVSCAEGEGGPPGDPALGAVESASPELLVLRPRPGLRPSELRAALEGARAGASALRGRGQPGLEVIERVELVGGVVRLPLRRPYAPLRRILCELRIAGTGAFRLAASAGRAAGAGALRLERVRGPGVPAIRVRVEPSPVRALSLLRRGEADILGRLPEAYWPEQAQAPSTQRAFEAVRTAPVRLSYLVWNLRRPLAGDPDVRRALAESVDRERLVRLLHRGLGEPAQPGFAFDPADAASRLERAGWHDTGAVRTQKGRLLRLSLLAAAGGHAARFVELWRPTLGKLGIEIDVSAVEGPGFAARLREGTFDLALCERPTPPGSDLSPLLGARGPENFGGLRAGPIEAALAAFRSGTGDDTAVWQAALAEAALIPLFRRSEVALVNRGLEGVRPAGDWLDLASVNWRR